MGSVSAEEVTGTPFGASEGTVALAGCRAHTYELEIVIFFCR